MKTVWGLRPIQMFKISLSWICYWLGDLSCKIDRLLGDFGEYIPFYLLYFKFMNWARELQGDDVRGPWGPVKDEASHTS